MSADKTLPSCLDAETLAAFAEGKLERREIPAVLAHLERCPDCMRALAAANDAWRETSSGSGSGWFRAWPLAAAAAVLALAAAGLMSPFLRQWLRPASPVERLAELAQAATRTVEPRLSGSFSWAPYRGPLRLGEKAQDARRLQLAGVAGELVEKADRDGSARSQHEAGVALVLIEQPLAAVARLRAATSRGPAEAKGWSDLAAALYAAALRLGRPALYPEALAAGEHALRLAPDLPEALFNRALTLERLGLPRQAREAWQRYLRTDPGSPWAAEAREHLERLPTTTGAALFERDRPRLEAAAQAGDAAAVDALVRRYPQLSRTTGELDDLAAWGEAWRRGDTERAARALAVARGIGAALARTSGEGLLEAAVRAIDTASTGDRATLAEAHSLYRRGRAAYDRQRPTEAEPDLRLAVRRFAAAGSPMALVARYYTANARFGQYDARGARAMLEELLAEADRRPRFIALGAQVRWELALCHVVDADWTGSHRLLSGAAAAFERLGERHHLGFIHTMLASALVSLGRTDEGWAARIRSFEILSAEGLGDRLAVSLGSAARLEAWAGRIDPARALLQLEQDIDRAAGSDILLTNALVREAVLSAALGDDDRASSRVREAQAGAERIADPRLRAAAQADVWFADGAAALRANPRYARGRLTQAIDFYRTAEQALFLPECQLLRARAALHLGATGEALRDLEDGIATVERHRIRFGGSATGTGVVDAGTALLAEAMRLAVARGDAAAAFAVAERTAAQLSPAGEAPVTLSELQRRLAGSATAVLELTLLPEELIAVAVTETDRSLARRPLSASRLAALVARVAAPDGEAAAGELYDLLLRPSAGTLAGARHLIVVAGPALAEVPYAALYDSAAHRYLVESLTVAVAPSAGALRAIPGSSRRCAVALALPAGGREEVAALPETEEEIAEVGRLYREATALSAARATFPALLAAAGRADVVHIASHTERLGGPGDSALVFAGGPDGGGQRVSWNEIATVRLPRSPVVCLAACATLCRSPEPQARALSLGAGFLAAGASDVIGTLAPIADADARELFRAVHRHLAAGESPAEAVRRAQLAVLAAETAGRRTAWRAVALLTRRIP